jgi:hypothetical protein
LPHWAQRKDPSYRMAEGVVIKSDLTSLPPTPSRRENGLYLRNHCSDLIQILNLDFCDQSKEDLPWKTTYHGR